MTDDIIITQSLIKQFKSCKTATRFKHIELLAPKRALSKPLTRGIWFHEMLEAKYSGESVAAAHKANKLKFSKLLDEEKEHLGDLPTEMRDLYQSYKWHYRNDESWTVHEVELKLEAELPSGLQAQGKIDSLIEDEFGLWIVDHKTHLRLPTWDYRALDYQAPFYIWLSRRNKIPVQGFIWNYIVPTAPKGLKFNLDGKLSKRQPTVQDYPTALRELLAHGPVRMTEETESALAKLKELAYDPDKPQTSPVFRRDRIEFPDEALDFIINDIDRTAKEYALWREALAGKRLPIHTERTPGRGCEWCEYRSLCIGEIHGHNTDGIRHREFTTHNPLARYEEGTK